MFVSNLYNNKLRNALSSSFYSFLVADRILVPSFLFCHVQHFHALFCSSNRYMFSVNKFSHLVCALSRSTSLSFLVIVFNFRVCPISIKINKSFTLESFINCGGGQTAPLQNKFENQTIYYKLKISDIVAIKVDIVTGKNSRKNIWENDN